MIYFYFSAVNKYTRKKDLKTIYLRTDFSHTFVRFNLFLSVDLLLSNNFLFITSDNKLRFEYWALLPTLYVKYSRGKNFFVRLCNILALQTVPRLKQYKKWLLVEVFHVCCTKRLFILFVWDIFRFLWTDSNDFCFQCEWTYVVEFCATSAKFVCALDRVCRSYHPPYFLNSLLAFWKLTTISNLDDFSVIFALPACSATLCCWKFVSSTILHFLFPFMD